MKIPFTLVYASIPKNQVHYAQVHWSAWKTKIDRRRPKGLKIAVREESMINTQFGDDMTPGIVPICKKCGPERQFLVYMGWPQGNPSMW